MIPEMRLSTTVQKAPFLLEGAQPTLTKSRHRGGIALSDASAGLDVKTWTAETDGTHIDVYASDVPFERMYSGSNITEVSLAFDQNMRPVIAFVEGGQAKFRWFDSVPQNYVVTTLPVGSITPRITLDDRRTTQTNTSDVILAYVRSGTLYYRQQRDRYQNEYQLATGITRPFVSVGMNTGLRLQFLFEG